MSTVQSLLNQQEPYARGKTIRGFCQSIKRRHGSLSGFDTESLASEYRKFFGLPYDLDEPALRRHCRQLGMRDLFKQSLPIGLGGFNISLSMGDAITLNSGQWSGIHPVTFFHELFEILERRYAEIDTNYVPLNGSALESKADKFAICIVLPDECGADLATIINAVPTLWLHLGETIVPILINRLRELVGPEGSWSSIHYARMTNCYRGGNGRVVGVHLNRSRQYLPRTPRRYLESMLPRFGDLTNQSWFAKQVIEYQGPVIVERLKGFDFHNHHDLSVLCVPILTDGQITDLWIFFFRADAFASIGRQFEILRPHVVSEIPHQAL